MIYSFVVFAALFLQLSVSNGKEFSRDSLFFYETFDEKDPFESKKWFLSKSPKYVNQPVLVKPSSIPAVGFENDNGLMLSQEMKYYGISSTFTEPLQMGGNKEIVIQYELKLEDTLSCGGAYVKLPRSTDGLNLEYLDNDTPYSVMFGPDKCGGNNKVHFILQHQNPVTGTWEEKHFNETIPIKSTKKTHLYTLVLRNDNSFDILIDNKLEKTGNLLTHMTPPINPPKEIDDPEDRKPSDWADEPKISDPEAKKPDDWDEDAPRLISDVNAVKPEGWGDNEPEEISDPEAVKPSDWDDEEDGVWEAPLVPNPVCEKVGCGKWEPPKIKNPDFKGKWSAPLIDNPAYKGPWKAKQISNPGYFYEENPASKIAPMSGIAVEVWTTNAPIFFDNFVITHSQDLANKFADSTFSLKASAENIKEKKEKKENSKKIREEKIASGNFREYTEARFAEALAFVIDNPWPCLASFLAFMFGVVLISTPNKNKQVALDAAASGLSSDAAGVHSNDPANPTPGTDNSSESDSKTTDK